LYSQASRYYTKNSERWKRLRLSEGMKSSKRERPVFARFLALPDNFDFRFVHLHMFLSMQKLDFQSYV
jgi:hypothetical protein